MGFLNGLFGRKKDASNAPPAVAPTPRPDSGASNLIKALESGDVKQVVSEASALAGQDNAGTGLNSLLMAVHLQVRNLVLQSAQVPEERFVNAFRQVRDAACRLVKTVRPDLYRNCQVLCEALGELPDPAAGDTLFHVAHHGYYPEAIRFTAIRSLAKTPGGGRWLQKLSWEETAEDILSEIDEALARLKTGA